LLIGKCEQGDRRQAAGNAACRRPRLTESKARTVDTYGWNYAKRYYDRLMWLSYSGWAWEFKRRDPQLIGLRRRAKSSPIILKRGDGSQLVRLRRNCRAAESIGLHFLPEPRLSAFDTPLFWLPNVMTTNLDAVAEMHAQLTAREQQLTWRDIPGKKTFLIVPGRRQKLAVTARGYAAQLAIGSGSSLLPLSLYLTFQMNPGARMLEHVRCIELFARHCAGVGFEITPRRGLSPGKLRQALIALDGWHDGASHREIASRLFGEEAVARDWETGVRSYKSRVRRLIRKGRALMKSEYLKLL